MRVVFKNKNVLLNFRPSISVDSLSHVPHIFLDANFDLKNPDTFAKIFPFLLNSQENLSSQIETHGRGTQEKLAQHLDSVEVNIADQVAQKSHHFFQVCIFDHEFRREVVKVTILLAIYFIDIF